MTITAIKPGSIAVLEPHMAVCKRCGITRTIKPGRKGGDYCRDCLPEAIAAGWAEPQTRGPRRPNHGTEARYRMEKDQNGFPCPRCFNAVRATTPRERAA